MSHRAKHLLLGISGSSAATATPELVAEAADHADRITVVATPTAAGLFLADGLPFPLFTDELWKAETENPLHVRLLEEVDWFVVAPATATTLARVATGAADTLLAALILAHGPGIYFQPSMNLRMWNNPATRRNIASLTADGHHILPTEPTESLTSDEPTAVGAIPGTVLSAAASHRGRHAM